MTIKLNNVEDWIEDPSAYSILQTPYAIHAFPNSLLDELYYLNEHLNITYFGTELGELKKDIFIPAHALALSGIIKKDFPFIKVDKENTIRFLRKASTLTPLQIEEGNPMLGWHVVKYGNLNIGWVKVLRDRVNNYLPNNWRILH